mgnify:CR=1 FL=1
MSPAVYVAWQLEPPLEVQPLTPPALAPTVPVPTTFTLSGYEESPVKTAETLFAAVMLTVQVVLLPEQSPDHPVNV